MKRILVPTDFSLPAENAAKYAISLATYYEAEVLIVNTFIVPAEAPMAARVAWPLMDYDTLKNESTTELDLLIQKLEGIANDPNQTAYKPVINFESHSGTVLAVTSKLVIEKKIDLVVMGMTGASALTQLLWGSTCKSMIEKATFPVMYIPFEADFVPLKTIGLATDLHLGDIGLIKTIVQLMEPMCPHIRLIHITEEEIKPDSKQQQTVDLFLNKVRHEIDKVSIDFEYIWNIDIDSGLDWLSDEHEVDVIAVAHRQKSYLKRILNSSHTQTLSRKTHLPLLVFPVLIKE
jgi:nucleotide-binding universal stress UspA family protein